MHVAVSTLRHAMEPDLPRGSTGGLVFRDGDAYRLRLPDDAFVDVVEFDDGLAQTRVALARDDTTAALAQFRRAMALHEGDLLPEEGPAEWIVGERDRRRLDVSELAGTLAEALLAAGEPSEAAWVARRGLQIDRYHDPLWRTLVRAYELAGDPAASARARREYQALLLELGLPAPANAPTDVDVLPGSSPVRS